MHLLAYVKDTLLYLCNWYIYLLVTILYLTNTFPKILQLIWINYRSYKELVLL